MIQCNHCGGRTLLNTVNGAYIKNGRKTGGTKIDENVCADCWRRSIFSPMLPELRRAE
jgi:DNA-directed RNA polymerase subunit RPC12/RpoP